MDHSSSSSSASEEASMDDSEQEHEYDYDIDDGDEDAHDDFEDIAEEDEEDEDEDEYDEHSHPLIMDLGSSLPHRLHLPRPSSGNHEMYPSRFSMSPLSPRQMFLQLQEVYGSQDSIMAGNAASAEFTAAELASAHASRGIPPPPFVMPSRSIGPGIGVVGIGPGGMSPGSSANDDAIRSFVMDTFDSVLPRGVGHGSGEPSRLMESFRIAPNGSSLLPTRVIRHSPLPFLSSVPHRLRASSNSDPPTTIHPHLAPTNPAFVINPTHGFDWFSPIGRRSAHIVPPIEHQRSASNLPPVPPSPNSSGNSSSASGGASPTRASSSSASDTLNSYEAMSGPHARALDAIHRVTSILPRTDKSKASESEIQPGKETETQTSSSSHVPQDFVSCYIPRSSEGESLQALLEADLMRTVAIAPRSEGPLEALARARSITDHRALHRDSERGRDKVPSGVAKRWRYEPVISSGDAVPGIFDAEMGRRHQRSFGHANSSPNPADIPKPLTQAASKVSSAIESMIIQIAAINDSISKYENKIEEDKKMAEKAKKKEQAEKEAKEKLESNQTEEDKLKMSDDTAEPSLSVANSTEPPAPEQPIQSTEDADALPSPSTVAAAIETALGVSNTDDEPEESQAVEQEQPEARTQGDSTMTETEPERVEEATNESRAQDTSEPSVPPPTPATTTPPSTENVAAEEEATAAGTTTGSGSQFSAVATERAAAAGISLDAPANENPEVVAAAMESTGIDPAFLSALPADVREEILTEYYERIRTNTNGQDGTSSSPPAPSVNQDFLMALPPTLRAEVLELEAEFQARRENRNNSASANAGQATTGDNSAGGNAAGNADAQGAANVADAEMDAATFLATLPPDLREDILLTSGDAVIDSLPPNVAAEARVLREREMQSRLPWRVGRGDPFSGPDGREMASGRASSGGRGRVERATPNEAPAYKWKKGANGWLREKPNVAHEPAACLKSDGISALVGLLWVRSGSYDKNILFQVLSHLCKTTDSRYAILDQLVSLITSKPEDPSMGSGMKTVLALKDSDGNNTDPERIRFHGTVVRRGLDLLTLLSKNDILVSETLLGLPKSDEELKRIGEISLDEDGQAVKQIDKTDSPKNLSTLMSLLQDRLFSRSISHLEQLVFAISLVAQAIPSQDVNGQEKSKHRRSHRNRSLLVRPGPLGDPMNVIYGVGDEEDGMIFHARDEDDLEEHLISDAYLSRGSSRGRSSGDVANETGDEEDNSNNENDGEDDNSNSNNDETNNSNSNNDNDNNNNNNNDTNDDNSNSNNNSNNENNDNNENSGTQPATADGSNTNEGVKKSGKKGSTKTEKPLIPVKYRIPVLQTDDLIALTKVLLREGCTEKTYDRVSKAIGLLGELPNNRMIFMRALVTIAHQSGESIWHDYEKHLKNGTQQPASPSSKKGGGIDSTFILGSAKNELTLLRVVKSLATLLKHNAIQKRSIKSKPDVMQDHQTDIQSSMQQTFHVNVVNGLRDLWSGLDQLLERVSDDVKSGKSANTPTSSTNPPDNGVNNSVRTGPRVMRTTRAASEVLNGERLKGGGGLSPILARLSPMIEAFLVTHCSEEEAEEFAIKAENKAKQSNSSSNTSSQTSSGSSSSPVAARASSSSSTLGAESSPSSSSAANIGRGSVIDEDKTLDDRVAIFVERHRVAINSLLRANAGLLERSFKGVLRHSHAIDFDNKKAYFRNVLRKRSSEAHARPIRINVRRERVFDDSYQQLRMRTPDEMKGRLHVQFVGEEGVDAGGVTREWYTILARQIFDPNYALFTRSAAKAATYQPDKRSYIHREHLENFRFVGRVIGKAIYDGQLLDAYFTRSFYKHILGLKPTYHDIEAQDPEYYKSLKWMLENNIDGILDYTMSAEYDEFGKQMIVDLLPDGRNVPVTEENKSDYVKLVTEVRMTKTIEKQIEAFKRGFYELIPYDDCKIFNELELELLMSGLPDIDVSDLKANVEYTGYTASSPQINWFWKCVSTMDQEDLARLVMFVTGTSKVPLEGFAQLQGMNGVQKFQIHRVGGNTMRLPSAHTCFNQLDLPEYSSSETLSERLLRAVRECSVGFGFA